MAKPKAVPIPSKMELLGKLAEIKYEKSEQSDRDRFDQVHLAGSLLLLAELGPESETAVAQSAAKHLLGYIPEPDDADLREE